MHFLHSRVLQKRIPGGVQTQNLIETKNPSGKPANCQPAGLPRGEMIPYIQANPRNFQINRAIALDSPKTHITARLSHLKTLFKKIFFLYFEKKYWKKNYFEKKYWKTIILKTNIGKNIKKKK